MVCTLHHYILFYGTTLQLTIFHIINRQGALNNLNRLL